MEAVLSLLEGARLQQPALRELPRDELAAEAAATALHALLALLAGQRAGGPGCGNGGVCMCVWGGGARAGVAP